MFYIIVNALHLRRKGMKKLNDVKAVFERAGKPYEVLFTRKKGDAKNFAQDVTSRGEECTVAVMGGDGTLHEVINGFKDFEKCRLGLIPFGTGNDFAEGAGLPLNHVKAAEIIANGTPRPIDFIELESGLRSINSVGMGIDVDVLKRTYAGKSRGKGKYLKALISSLIHFESKKFTIKYDGKEETHLGLIAAVGNGRQFGGGIKIFPDAKIDDGYMDIIIVDYISKIKIPAAFIKLMRGKVDKVKKVTIVKTKAAEFVSEDAEFTIQAEGELYENLPINAHIVAGQLKFYLPESK